MTIASSQSNSNPSLKSIAPTTGSTPSKSVSDVAVEEYLKASPDGSSQGSLNNSPPPTDHRQAALPRRWLGVGAAILGLSIIATIPLPHYVTGQAEIMSRTHARQRFVMPVSGRVQIYVRANQQVQSGQLIAEIQSDELDNQLAQAQRELERAQQGVSGATGQLMVAEAKLKAASSHEAIARDRQQRSSQRLNRSFDEPISQRLQQERSVFSEEIAAIEASIAGIESEIAGLQGQLTAINKTIAAYESLQSAGAVRAAELWEARGRQAALRGQIDSKRSAIAAQRRQIEQQRSLRAAHTAQMDEANQQLEEVLDTDSDELGRVAAQTATARAEVEAAVAQIQSQQQLVAKWKADIAQFQQQREKLKLVAQTTGTAITPDLDLLDGTRLEAGQEILSVVDLRSLTARVRIRQEDRDLVESSAKVRFYRQGDGQRYSAVVSDSSVVPVVQTEENHPKPMVEVRMEIDNRAGVLLPGMEGYAHIRSRNLPVYQLCGREFNKLFNLGKYFPWLE